MKTTIQSLIIIKYLTCKIINYLLTERHELHTVSKDKEQQFKKKQLFYRSQEYLNYNIFKSYFLATV